MFKNGLFFFVNEKMGVFVNEKNEVINIYYKMSAQIILSRIITSSLIISSASLYIKNSRLKIENAKLHNTNKNFKTLISTTNKKYLKHCENSNDDICKENIKFLIYKNEILKY